MSPAPLLAAPSRTGTAPQHYLRAGDLDSRQIVRLLDLAAKMREDAAPFEGRLHGESVACYFEMPSTRARVSFEAAAHRLGMLPIMLRPDELQLVRGEAVEDTGRALSSYCRAIVARMYSQDCLERLAGASTVPVVNALSGDHDPCQALADLLTIRDVFGELAGLRVAFVGDATNVAHSLMEAVAVTGMHLAIASPPRYQVRSAIAERAAATAARHGGSIRLTDDPRDAVDDVDVVYADAWLSMGDEDHAHARLADLAPFQVTVALMHHARAHAVFMHCLPATRGREVTADVIDGDRSVVFHQAANRLPTELAVLWALCTGNWPSRAPAAP